MSNVNPSGDDPKRPYKAVTAGALSFVAAFIAYWIADKDPFTAKEVGEAVLTGGVSAGLIGGGTFAVRNPKRNER